MRIRTLLVAVAALVTTFVAVPAPIRAEASWRAATPDQKLQVHAVRSLADGRVSLVLELPMPATAEVTVTALAGDQEVATQVEPALSDRSALALVLDASADGAPFLNSGGLAGAANFLLQLPAGARTSLIADRDPPEAVAGPSVGVADELEAVSSLRTAGARSTAAALTLALKELTGPPGGQAVIVLYTTASAAEGEPASALAERLRAAGAVVAVVDAGGGGPYWPTVAAQTGGVAITAAPQQSLEAFDTVAEALRRRSVVTFDRPPAGAPVTLRVDTATGSSTVAVDLTGADAAPPGPVGSSVPTDGAKGRDLLGVGWWPAAAAALVVAGGIVLLSRRRRRSPATVAASVGAGAEPSLFEDPAEVDLADSEEQRDAAVTYQRQAALDRAEGRVALAASGYRQAIDALVQRVELDPGNPAFQHDLAVAALELAELDAEQGWIVQAASRYRQAIEIGEHLVVSVPGNADYQHTLDLALARAAALTRPSNPPAAAPHPDPPPT